VPPIAASASLIAVSKGRSAEEIEALIAPASATSARSRVQEAQAKWPPCAQRYPDVGCT
jgi:uncharacterized pyridoxal phosphate-containing UPF0001 family protein